MTKWEQSSKLILLQLRKKLLKNFSLDHCMVIVHLKQIGKVRKLDKWVPHELTRNQKKSSFWIVVFTYPTQQQQTLSLLDCDMWQKEDFMMTSLVTGLRRSSKVLPKAKLVPQNRSWSLFGGLLLVWSPTASWTPTKPLHLRSILSKSRRWTENCNACSWRWSPGRGRFCTTTSGHILHNQRFKSWMNCATKFCAIHHFTWALTNPLPRL